MRSRWLIKKVTIKSGRVRYEPWFDGKYYGRFDTHEDAWAVIEEKRFARHSTPENATAAKAQVEHAKAAAKAVKAGRLKLQKRASRLAVIARARSRHPDSCSPVGTAGDLETA